MHKPRNARLLSCSAIYVSCILCNVCFTTCIPVVRPLKQVGLNNKRQNIYIAEQLHKCAFVGLCMNNKFTVMQGMEHRH